MRHHRRFDWVKFLFIGGLIVLIIAAIGIYAKSLSPYQQLRDQAEKIATNRADLKTVNGFWWYNRVIRVISPLPVKPRRISQFTL